AAEYTESVWPWRVSSSCFLATSQTLAVLSRLAVTRNLPSGENATPLTPPVWPLGAANTWCVWAARRGPVLSKPAVARRLPSGAKATERTDSRSRNAAFSWPVAASQSCSAPGLSPIRPLTLATVLPSGEKTAHHMYRPLGSQTRSVAFGSKV